MADIKGISFLKKISCACFSEYIYYPQELLVLPTFFPFPPCLPSFSLLPIKNIHSVLPNPFFLAYSSNVIRKIYMESFTVVSYYQAVASHCDTWVGF